MNERIEAEFALIRSRYPAAEYQSDGHWIRIPAYSLPPGWSLSATDVAFPIPVGYPGVPPYGIYVPSGLLFQGAQPDNYTDPAGTQPPFQGSWAIFSWAPDGEWRATADIHNGSNLINWIAGFAVRFREGK
jgi:hypothetical protein